MGDLYNDARRRLSPRQSCKVIGPEAWIELSSTASSGSSKLETLQLLTDLE
jgi:hypothetical protein